MKDDEDKTLPEDMVTGEIGWVAPEPHLTGRLLQSDNTIGMARNFSCGQNQYLCGLGFETPDYLDLVDGQTLDLGIVFGDLCLATGPPPGVCKVGGNKQIGQITSGVTNSFSSGNSAVAAFMSNTPPPSTSTWKGMSGGSTTGIGSMSSTTLGECQGTAPITVQIPHADPVISTSTNAAQSCTVGTKAASGWVRTVTKNIVDTNNVVIAVLNQSLYESYVINGSQNPLGIVKIGTGHGYTTASGQFPDDYDDCSTYCPSGTGSTAATQSVSDILPSDPQQTYYLIPDNISYGCSAILINGK